MTLVVGRLVHSLLQCYFTVTMLFNQRHNATSSPPSCPFGRRSVERNVNSIPGDATPAIWRGEVAKLAYVGSRDSRGAMRRQETKTNQISTSTQQENKEIRFE